MYVRMYGESTCCIFNNTKLASTVVLMPSIGQPDLMDFFSLYLSKAVIGNASRESNLLYHLLDTEVAPSLILWKSLEC